VLTAPQLLALIGVWIVGAYTPGPDMLLVVQRSLASRSAGFAATAGVVTGVTVWLAASILGLAAILQAREGVLHWLQLAGGLFLVGMGILGVRAAWPGAVEAVRARADTALPPSHRERANRPARRDYARGLATNLSNPKAVVFFGSLLAPFLYPGGTGLSFAASAGIFALLVALAFAAFTSVVLLASHPTINGRIRRFLPVVDAASGALFVVIGALIAVAAIGALT